MATQTIGRLNSLLMLALIMFWGSSFVVVKIVLQEGLTPVAVATFRFLIAGGLFLVALLVQRGSNRRSRLLIEKKDMLTVLSLALSGVTLFFTAQYVGIQMAGAAIAAIFVCFLSPIFITILSTKILQEKLSKRQFTGVGIAAAGTLIVIAGGTQGLQNGQEFFVGGLVLLFTPILWTVYSLLGKKTMEKYNPFLVVAYVTMLGGVLLVPLSLAENSLHRMPTMSPTSWLGILFLSVTCSFLGYYIWFYVLRRVGAAVTSSFLFAEPLVTALFAAAFVGEEITVSTLAGGLMIFTGVYLVTKRTRKAYTL